MRAGSLPPQVRRLLAVAFGAALAFAVVYLLAVQTELGQRIDDAALRGSERAPELATQRSSALLQVVSVGSIALAVAVLGALAYRRERPWLVLLPAVIVGASLLATEILKLWVLPRPDLVVDLRIPENSYPSGHTAVAISVGLAAVAVAPPRWRAAAAFAAAALAGGAGVLVVSGVWHRPSDPIGSYALTLAVTATVLAAVLPRAPELGGEHRHAPAGALAGRIEITAIVAGGLLFLGSILIASLRYGPDIDWTRPDAAFLGSVAVIAAAAGLAVGALVRALGAPGSRGSTRFQEEIDREERSEQ